MNPLNFVSFRSTIFSTPFEAGVFHTADTSFFFYFFPSYSIQGSGETLNASSQMF